MNKYAKIRMPGKYDEFGEYLDLDNSDNLILFTNTV